MINESDTQILESLRPRSDRKIMDLVAEAGIDVTPWGVKKDGSMVKNPRTNPAYCYEWAFGGSGQPTVLCIWYNSLAVSDGLVFYEDSIRQHASKLNLIAIDRSKSSGLRSRARKQEDRAQNFDTLLQHAYRRSNPIRVVILLGDPDPESDISWGTSKVRCRALDSEVWYVHSYSEGDGSCRLVRKVRSDSMQTGNDVSPTQPVFVDQFSLPEPPGKHESAGSAFDRSSEVRQMTLRRAAGVCECCAAPGFKTNTGALFLETHHVVPLSENGPDRVWNVIALCPNDHRRAHFGEDRASLRDRFIAHLLSLYPDAENALRTLSDASSAEVQSS